MQFVEFGRSHIDETAKFRYTGNVRIVLRRSIENDSI